MNLREFNEMDLDRKCDAIWEWGFYVSRQKTNTINAVLYSINGFFAEMIMRLEDNTIIDVVAIETITKTEEIGYFIKKDNPFAKYL
jgi:hypothetical protein